MHWFSRGLWYHTGVTICCLFQVWNNRTVDSGWSTGNVGNVGANSKVCRLSTPSSGDLQYVIKMFPTPDVAAGCRLIGSGESPLWAVPSGNVAVVTVQQLDGIDIDVETKRITHPRRSELTWPCSAHNRSAVLRGSASKRLMIPKQIKTPEASIQWDPVWVTGPLCFCFSGRMAWAVVLLKGWEDGGEKEVLSTTKWGQEGHLHIIKWCSLLLCHVIFSKSQVHNLWFSTGLSKTKRLQICVAENWIMPRIPLIFKYVSSCPAPFNSHVMKKYFIYLRRSSCNILFSPLTVK